jgi:tetratricopeptide (TPR) repeat protein
VTLDEEFDEVADEAPRLGWLRLSLFYVLVPFESLFSFVADWCGSRPWFSLVLGLPAIFSGLAFVAVGAWHARTSQEQWADRYDQAGKSALNRNDFQAAAVYYRRAASLVPHSTAVNFGLALTAEQQGDLPSARRRMQRIAPETDAGYPPAHLWLAADLLRQESTLSPEGARALEHHLLQALRSRRDEPRARANLARLYMLRGETAKAIEHTEQLVARNPSMYLNLARLYTQAGRTGDAHRAAARASEYLQARTLEESGNPLNRLSLAASLVMQEQYEDAKNVLTAGLNWPDPEPFHRALAALYMHWLSAITGPEKPDPVRQLEFLELAVQHDASNQSALVMLCNLALGQHEVATRASELLNQVLERGAVAPIIHLTLGTRAMQRNEQEAALLHYQQAQQHIPQLPALFNNLAWDLAHQDKPNLELALSFAEVAVHLWEHPEFRDTLGTVLAKLGRAQDAVEHLEIALQELPPRADIHDKLGDLYQQLGDEDAAAEHYRQAAELQSPAVENQPD